MQKTKNKILAAVVALLFFANFFVWKEVFGFDNNLKVIFFNVGQGDSIFIETPQKHQILIDGGPSENIVLEKLGKQMPFWDKTIDLIVLTHSDFDHLNGLLGVLEKYKVGHVLWTGVGQDTTASARWDIDLLKEKTDIVLAKQGVSIKADKSELRVLYPFVLPQGQESSNDLSIVSRLVFNNFSFLFLGDISYKVEKKILENGVDIKADVLKVAHHGSKDSTSQDFIAAIAPKVAVISCGKDNQYGHPHQGPLSVLENFGIKVLRIDTLGDIELIANGDELLIINN